MGRIGTARSCLSTLNSFRRFRAGKDLSFRAMNEDLVERYEAFLLESGLRRNTSSFYLRNLRTVYRAAAEQGLVERKDIFCHVYTGFDKTVKRAIDMDYVKRMCDLQLSADTSMGFARDVFLFSIFTRGMPFVDMAYLRKSDLRDGYLCYRRKKTHRSLMILWEPQMQEIVDRYAEATRNLPYMLPIITRLDGTERRQYEAAIRKVNCNLKRIAERIGLGTSLTTYVARHTWASMAHTLHTPLSVISEALGHDSEKTTQTYIAQLNSSAVDDANKRILMSL